MANENEGKIKVTKNGLYLVTGGIPLYQLIIKYDSKQDFCEWVNGKELPQQDTYALCRCGYSSNKPFCDGAHVKVRFDGSETASPDTKRIKAIEINGPALKLIDREQLCASARFCHKAGGIWNLIPKSDDPETRKIVMEEMENCPSGRLVICDKKTGTVIEPKLERSIAIIEDPFIGTIGPIWVCGGIPIESANGKQYETRNRVTLCRCGKSGNKPFCDSSHYPD